MGRVSIIIEPSWLLHCLGRKFRLPHRGVASPVDVSGAAKGARRGAPQRRYCRNPL